MEPEEGEKYQLKVRADAGWPVNRVAVSLRYCEQSALKAIGSRKKCKSRKDTLKWMKGLTMTIQHNQPLLDMKNLRNVSSIFNTTE